MSLLNFTKITLLVLLSILGGCVKLKVLPDDVVGKSVKATQNIYNETKLKRSGGVKKNYEREVLTTQYASSLEAETACLTQLKSRINRESPRKPAVILTEKVKPTQQAIRCQATAFIWQ